MKLNFNYFNIKNEIQKNIYVNKIITKIQKKKEKEKKHLGKIKF